MITSHTLALLLITLITASAVKGEEEGGREMEIGGYTRGGSHYSRFEDGEHRVAADNGTITVVC